MNNKPKLLIAGATGYLGRHLVNAAEEQGIPFRALVRNKKRARDLELPEQSLLEASVTDSSTLNGVCDGIDIAISCVGITRQKDGLTYEFVDYQANINLLREAERAGVTTFIYISAFNAPRFQTVRLLRAKERFAKELLRSTNLVGKVIRPNGFFADIEAFYEMANAGRIYLFGNGEIRLNPIHGKDLAEFVLASLSSKERELDIGGPQVLSLNTIAIQAFEVTNRPPKITYIPDSFRKLALAIASFLPEKITGPAEFFLTTMAQDMIAPSTGTRTLQTHFKTMHQQRNAEPELR